MSDSVSALANWIARVSRPGWTWYAKYISANDTYAKSNVHQGGPYVGKDLLRAAFPVLTERADGESNPDLTLPARIASHGIEQTVRLIWYNSRRLEKRPNGRDEARMTNWGGRDHPLVNENATGSIVVFAFHQHSHEADADGCEVWITSTPEEEDDLIGVMGPMDPGISLVFRPALNATLGDHDGDSDCAVLESEMKPEWRTELPSGEEILAMVLERRPRSSRMAIDARLMARRDCEFELFRSIESHVVLPRVREGFDSVEAFVSYAHSVTNRRKSRAGRSLELHARQIFSEEGLQFSWTERTEDKRTPDFIFPSIQHYHESTWPSERLRMLAAKTTCKDRWRQVLNEASRIPTKHLLTLQEGVSIPQFREMKEEGVRLVVPSRLHAKYPEELREELVSFESFVEEAKRLV
jgi:hypothetical protein